MTRLTTELFAALAGLLFAAAVRWAATGGARARLTSIADQRTARTEAHAGPVTGCLAWVGRRRWASRLRGERDALSLQRSGWSLAPEAFAGLRLVCGVIGLAIVIGSPWPAPLLAPLFGIVGARVPTFFAARSAKRRLAAIDAEVPQLLDLLAAASSAGLSAPLALRRAAEGVIGPLAGEIEVVLRAVDLGARWRDELGAAADRLGLPDVRRTVVAMTRTETLGSSLAGSTAELAASVRQSRRAAVTERARTAPVKMLFPLVFLVLPAFLLLTVVPVLLTTLQSIR